MKRNFAIESAKVVLALMVVGIHVDLFIDYDLYINFISVNGLFRIAVPLFFIINGYYFFNIKSYPDFKVWLKRILSLYILWMTIYAYFWIRNHHGDLISSYEFLKILLIGYHHLWYISGMIGAGVISYLLRDRIKVGMAFSISLFVIGVVLQYVYNGVFSIGQLNIESNYYYRNFLFLAFPFFYIGYLINNFNLHEKISGFNFYLFIIVALATSILEVVLLLKLGGSGLDYDVYFSLIVFVPIIFMTLLNSGRTINSIYLSQISTSIYLVHPICLLIMKKLDVVNSLALMVGTISLSLVASVFLIYIKRLSKIRFIL
ncbi:acyltransferase family protein [Vibrio coralliirubri]|uniref:acyltransferase family protein n=1 Tax=Vibrio coralliirubri TaxID=1516159 RepID=UPI0006396389|nr:acyltransferase [Vibrio coralliirubri]CDS95344.1 conserved membrane hypothetical protein [Vibrio coralliirubri]